MQDNMLDRVTNNRPRYRTMIFTALALALAILSTQGALDRFAQEGVADTTTESIGIFVLSRTFNAAVSTLQSSRVGVGASMQIGEALDPINDAVERLSSVMVWAIGSLLIQGVILDVVSRTEFKWMFVVITIVTISTLMLAEWYRSKNIPNANLDRYSGHLIRIFVLAAIFRFVVPTFVAISLFVSQQLLQPEIDEHRNDLSVLNEEVLGAEQEILDEMTDGDQIPDDLNEESPVPNEEGGLVDRFLSEPLSAITDAVRQILSSVSVSLPSLSLITDLRERAGELVENLTRLLGLVAIKNIVLPLVFLMIAVKGTGPIARWLIGLSTTDNHDSKELRTA